VLKTDKLVKITDKSREKNINDRNKSKINIKEKQPQQ